MPNHRSIRAGRNRALPALPVLTAVVLALCGCPADAAGRQEELPVAAETFAVDGAKATVCILSYGTEYKQRLRSALIEELNDRGISVTVAGLDRADDYDPGDYDAVVLLSSVEAFRPRTETRRYIKAHGYPANLVYVSTYAAFDRAYRRGLDAERIDAVTSASDLEDPAVLARTVEATLELILSKAGATALGRKAL